MFIAVDHEEDIAHLYLSDITGQFYITSLENVVGLRYPGKFELDLVKVRTKKYSIHFNRFIRHITNCCYSNNHMQL